MNIVNAVFTCFPERERDRGQGLGSWFSEVFLPFYELEKSAAPGERLARRPPVNLSEYFGCKNQLVLPDLLYVNRSVYDSPVVWTFIRIIGQLWSRKCWVIIIKKKDPDWASTVDLTWGFSSWALTDNLSDTVCVFTRPISESGAGNVHTPGAEPRLQVLLRGGEGLPGLIVSCVPVCWSYTLYHEAYSMWR